MNFKLLSYLSCGFAFGLVGMNNNIYENLNRRFSKEDNENLYEVIKCTLHRVDYPTRQMTTDHKFKEEMKKNINLKKLKEMANENSKYTDDLHKLEKHIQLQQKYLGSDCILIDAKLSQGSTSILTFKTKNALEKFHSLSKQSNKN
ncbi:MAG: hypothetical protein ACXWL2_01805 [Candidatus Chromulinivorax sp.]